MKIDFHSHILPGIDDGSRNIEESIALLDMMAEDGVDVVCATPHFYMHEISIDGFINRRNEAYESLKPHLKPEHPKILLGAEVLYNHALVSCDDTPKLCLQGTDYLLWEMPYTQITSAIVSDTEELAGLNQLKIMVAHIERYLHFTSYNELSELMSLDVIGQINAVSLTKFSSRSKIKKLIKDGFVYLLGTDYHRTTSGHALLGEAEDIIRSKFDERMIKRIANNGEKVLANEPIHKLHSL
ncbi:MAG: histidinol-phosphatase [Ruminococcus sp.]|nr:histidinol-phosphatase [Ruminococcus sp.]